MQRRVLFIRAQHGLDVSLYALKGTEKLDKPTRRKQLTKSVVKQFKRSYGGVPETFFSSLPLLETEQVRASTLPKINNDFCPSKVCTLNKARKVFFRGATKPLIVLVGEAPGEEEALTGTPFVGRSGKLLDELLARAGYRGEFAITNTVLCRPPHNREPEYWEKRCCLIRLFAFLEKTKPKGVICIGQHASSLFFPIAYPLTGENNLPVNCCRTIDMGAMRFLHIRHPSFILRKGGLSTKDKATKELIDDTVFTMKLFRDLIQSTRVPKNKTWTWMPKLDVLLQREYKLGHLLVPAVVGR
jgi:DNA polymerase